MSGFAREMLADQWTRPPCCKAVSLCGRFARSLTYVWSRPLYSTASLAGALCVSPRAVDVYICRRNHGAVVCGQILTGPSDVTPFSAALGGKKNVHTSRNRSVQLFSGSASGLKASWSLCSVLFFLSAVPDLLSEGVNIKQKCQSVAQSVAQRGS